MKKSLLFLIIISIALFYTSCSDDDTIINPPGNQSGTFTGTASGTVDSANGPTDVTRHFDGEGNSEMIGPCFATMDYMIQTFNSTTGGGTFWQGSGVLISKENGDKLFALNMTGSFQFNGDSMTFTADGVISGGTGKFKNMSGTAHYVGGMLASTRHGWATWTINYTYVKEFGGKLDGRVYPQLEWNCGSIGPYQTMGRTGDGTGQMVQLGLSTADFKYCVAYVSQTEGFVVDKGVDNYIIAQNGDQLKLRIKGGMYKVAGTEVYNDTTYIKVVGMISGEIIGGTGMYTNASGKVHCEARQLMTLQNPTTNPAYAFTTWYGGWNY